MPEILLWLGIDRIDWLLSMSREKYDALIQHNIKIILLNNKTLIFDYKKKRKKTY